MTIGVDGAALPRYRLLGPVTVTQAGEPLAVVAPKALAVLAVLLLQANRVVTSDRLFALVWGGDPPRSVRGRLQVYISQWRALLGPQVITRVGDDYKINVGAGELDVQVFTDDVTRARAELRAGRAVDAAQRLRSALGLWRGPALGAVTEALIQQERPVLEERRLNALEELFTAELAARRHAEVVDELRQAAANNPLREGLAAHLMRALHHGGRRAEALQVYTDIHRRLVDELGVEPGQRLREMQLRVLNDDLVSDSVDEQQHSPLEVLAPELPLPAGLPRDIAGFVGRADIVGSLATRLIEAPGAVAVISGAAGIGKTALAIHCAHSVRGHFPDGQLYCDLRGYDPDHDPLTPAAALGHMLTSLGVPSPRIPDGVAERSALYRAMLADRPTLVLLDNARDAQHVLPLLPPSGSVVVTSRRRLSDLVAASGAHAVHLSALSDQESRMLLDAVLGTGRVAAEPEAAAELVGLCAGLPLALRIAAATLATHPQTSLHSVVSELTRADRLAALSVDGSEQSAVASAFAASYRVLPPEHQRLFRLLGLIPGADFTPHAAAALADLALSTATRHLKALAGACVIEQHTADGRYRLHDLIRLYAADKARHDPDRDHAWNRLVDYYLCGAIAATDSPGPGWVRLPRTRPPLPACAHLDHQSPRPVNVELANMAAAATLAATQGPYPAAWLLAERLRSCYHRAGRRTEWLHIAPTILAAAEHRGERDVQALLHHSLGCSYFRAIEQPQGLTHLGEAIRLARECGWQECHATVLTDLGLSLAWTGRMNEAIGHLNTAIAIFTQLGSTAGMTRALEVLAGQYFFLGKIDLAEKALLDALDRSHTSVCARVDTAGLEPVARLTHIETLVTRALQLYGEHSSPGSVAVNHARRSELYTRANDHHRAKREAIHARNLSKDSGAKVVEATSLRLLANAEVTLGEHSAAEKHLRAATHIIAHAQLPLHEAENFTVLARLQTQRGQYHDAIDHAQHAATTARRAGYLAAQLTATITLTDIYLRTGHLDRATAIGHDTLSTSRASGLVLHERGITQLLADHGLLPGPPDERDYQPPHTPSQPQGNNISRTAGR